MNAAKGQFTVVAEPASEEEARLIMRVCENHAEIVGLLRLVARGWDDTEDSHQWEGQLVQLGVYARALLAKIDG